MTHTESRKPTLTEQREAVEELIAEAVKDDMDGETIARAKQACLTLAWIERSTELIKMLNGLKNENPELFEMLNKISSTFPGVKIDAIRGRAVPDATETDYDPDES